MRAVTRSAYIVAVVAVVVTAAGTGGLADQITPAIPRKPDDRAVVHVLNRLGFGAAPGDVERVRTSGLAAYIDQQLQPERIDDSEMTTRLAAFETLAKSTQEMAQQYYLPAQMARRELQRQQAAPNPAGSDPAMTAPPQNDAARRDALREMMTPEQAEAVRMERQALTELMQAKILRAAYSDRQLEEVMVDFWFNHFNVFSGKGQVRVYLTEYERDAIRPHVLGTFRELLQATAESPAMLFYLDNWQSSAPEGAPTAAPRPDNGRVNPRNPNRMPGRPAAAGRPQKNRPRTLAELPPGLQNRRAGLNENYARELMELHTLGVEGGYTQKDVQEVARAFTGWTIANPRQGGGFRFEPRMHDDGEKAVLGHKIKSGGGQKDGDTVLDVLANHPSTAQFIATKLARRFVADDPPKALVERAVRRFRDTGGNIREVVRTIVTSPEFFAPDAYRAKVKTPFEFVVSAVRATGTETGNALPLVMAVRNLGMPLYGCQPPTGYSDKAEAWVNSGALLNRMNFAVSLTASRQQRGAGVRPVQGRTGAGPSVTSDALVASALAGELSETTAATVAKATTPSQALALVLGSPEFQRR
jgi:uncharacterized protein (DUF1800 family)